MDVSPVRIARDYNQSLSPPVRAMHVMLAAVTWAFAPIIRWATRPTRRWWAVPALTAFVLFAILLPFDGPIHRALQPYRRGGPHALGGDFFRELEFVQQFGDFLSSALIAIAILLLDPAMRKRMLDWVLAAILSGVGVLAVKKLVGRPRPSLGEPGVFLGPWRAFPMHQSTTDALGNTELRVVWRHAWESGVSDLWSMPSSHTAAGVVLALALARMYPALRPLALILAVLVGVARVMLGAHYVTDVVIGATLGTLSVRLVMDRRVGQRLVDWCGALLAPRSNTAANHEQTLATPEIPTPSAPPASISPPLPSTNPAATHAIAPSDPPPQAPLQQSQPVPSPPQHRRDATNLLHSPTPLLAPPAAALPPESPNPPNRPPSETPDAESAS